MAYVVAGAVAAGLLLFEQLRRKHLWFWIPATHWWLARALVEAGYAIALTAAALQVPDSILSLNGILLGAISGVAGPRGFGRARVPVHGFNLNLISIAYGRMSKPLDDEIDESSAEVERLYVENEIRPRAASGELNSTAIANAFRAHLEGRRNMDDTDREARRSFIETIVTDNASDEEKVVALVYKVYQIGAYRALKDLLKDLPKRPYGWPGHTDHKRSGEQS